MAKKKPQMKYFLLIKGNIFYESYELKDLYSYMIRELKDLDGNIIVGEHEYISQERFNDLLEKEHRLKTLEK